MAKTHNCITRDNPRLYRIYCGMKYRCNNPSNTAYKYYGGRGIKVCQEWMNGFSVFLSWAKENGYSDDMELDRIDPNGDYCPENCRWVTHREQMNNTRRNLSHKYLTINGETKTILEWCKISGISPHIMSSRINIGIPAEKLIEKNLPIGSAKRAKKILCVETGIVYENISDLERKTGFNRAGIYAVLGKANRSTTAHGYHWKYADESEV